jgi:hypothetical protein
LEEAVDLSSDRLPMMTMISSSQKPLPTQHTTNTRNAATYTTHKERYLHNTQETQGTLPTQHTRNATHSTHKKRNPHNTQETQGTLPTQHTRNGRNATYTTNTRGEHAFSRRDSKP